MSTQQHPSAVPRNEIAGDQSGTPGATYCTRETVAPRGKPLRQAQEQEQQAAQVTQEHEFAIQELRRQTEEQPALRKSLWRRQLSQQSTYRAETHELYTEMLNMREKSEMQSHVTAHMCKLENTVPSRSVESFRVEVWESELRTCLTLDLQVDVRHGFFQVKWRLQTGQLPQVCSHQ